MSKSKIDLKTSCFQEVTKQISFKKIFGSFQSCQILVISLKIITVGITKKKYLKEIILI